LKVLTLRCNRHNVWSQRPQLSYAKMHRNAIPLLLLLPRCYSPAVFFNWSRNVHTWPVGCIIGVATFAKKGSQVFALDGAIQVSTMNNCPTVRATFWPHQRLLGACASVQPGWTVTKAGLLLLSVAGAAVLFVRKILVLINVTRERRLPKLCTDSCDRSKCHGKLLHKVAHSTR
jgi:hypothetical protein